MRNTSRIMSMTYELGLEIYASAWFGVTGTLILMAKWLREKMESLYVDYVNRVDEKNGDLGLDRSVDATDIARDYLLPVGGGAIKDYVRMNNYPQKQYVSELNKDVGRPVALVVFITLFVFAIVMAFSGPGVYYVWGLTYVAEYLLALYALVGVNLAAYLVL